MREHVKFLTRWAVVAAVGASPWLFHATVDRWTGQPDAGVRLRIAAMEGALGTVTEELAGGADVNGADAQGDTPLNCAAAGGSVAVVERLLAAGAHIDRADDWGDTPLINAARSDRAAVARLLLARGASATWRNCNGLTARDVAELVGADEALAVLSGAGAAADGAAAAAAAAPIATVEE